MYRVEVKRLKPMTRAVQANKEPLEDTYQFVRTVVAQRQQRGQRLELHVPSVVI